MTERMNRLRQELERHQLDGLVVSKPANIRYLCGATGTSCELLVTPTEALLLSSFVDITQNAETAEGVVHGRRSDPPADVSQAVQARRLRRVGVEVHVLPVATFERYQSAMSGVELVPTTAIVERLRWVKEPDELSLIERGMAINDHACRWVQEHLHEGMTEREISLSIERVMRAAGADRINFLLLQTGPNSAKPHHGLSNALDDRTLERGDFILCDIGAGCRGYGSDTTRTFVLGEPTERQQAVYDAVFRAQQAAMAVVKPGVTGGKVHEASRAVIAEAGYANYYGHGVGHGINEGPSLGPSSTDVLAPGHVVTIEPGIYVPGWGGVRIEDTIVVTNTGYRTLAGFPKDWAVLAS